MKNKVTTILGYGPQGRGQGLNMRDQGFNVILGLRKGASWNKALEDGWVVGGCWWLLLVVGGCGCWWLVVVAGGGLC